MQNKFLKIVIGVMCSGFSILCIILCFKPNVMSQIGKLQAGGLNYVPEIEGYYPEWEWWEALETFGMHTLDYREEYLKDDILSISLGFRDDSRDVLIYTMINISESDKVRMGLNAVYDYKEKKLIYRPVSIYIGEPNNSVRYSDEKSIDEYLSKYGLTRQDVKEYQEYAVYDVIVKTWTKAHITQWYWLESRKLRLCKVEDNTFQFEEESTQAEVTLAEKENDLWEHIIIIKEKSYRNDIPKYEKEYDEAGNMIKEVSYIDYSVGSISWHEYEYDNMGNEIKFVCRYDNGDIAWYYESEYDESGNRIKLSYYDGDGGLEHEYKYEYDEMGNVTKIVTYDEDGSMLEWEKMEYEYDEMGNMTKRAYYKGEYAMLFWDEYEYEYSECGSVSRKKEFHYYSSDDIPSWDEYEYDEAGNEIKFTRGKGENNIETWSEYEYDEMGNKVKETTYHSDGSIESWDEYEYNEAGCEIKETSYHADGSIPYVGCFEYDEMGNRIKYTHLESKAESDLQVKYVMKYEYEYAYVD